MNKQAIRTQDAPHPVASYSQAIAYGPLLQVAGQGPLDPDTGEFVGTTIQEQTDQTLRNIATILEAAGSSFEDVTMMRVYLSELEHFSGMNEVYSRYVKVPFPARTTVAVGLPPGMLIEVDALAVRPDIE